VSALVRLAVSDCSPVDVASFSPLGRLASSLRSLDQLDRRSECLTIDNNWAYYNLGTVYKAFCMVIRPSSPSLLLSIPTPYPQPSMLMFCYSTMSDLLRCGLGLRPIAGIKRGYVSSLGL
jgi:hypothetical protein